MTDLVWCDFEIIRGEMLLKCEGNRTRRSYYHVSACVVNIHCQCRRICCDFFLSIRWEKNKKIRESSSPYIVCAVSVSKVESSWRNMWLLNWCNNGPLSGYYVVSRLEIYLLFIAFSKWIFGFLFFFFLLRKIYSLDFEFKRIFFFISSWFEIVWINLIKMWFFRKFLNFFFKIMNIGKNVQLNFEFFFLCFWFFYWIYWFLLIEKGFFMKFDEF